MEASLQGCLIITNKYLRFNNADAIETSYFPERLEIRPQTPNNPHYFKPLGKLSEKFASAETYRPCD